MLDRSDIQGLLFSGYASTPRSRAFLVRLTAEGARPWLGRLLPRVTTGARGDRRSPVKLNVAFSASGLAALGLGPRELATFPREFQSGMADPERANVLGDHEDDAAEHWEFGNGRKPVDALVLLYAATDTVLDETSAELEEELERFGHASEEEDTYLPADGREHFGFVDGISNVRLEGAPRVRGRNPFDPRVPAGEFVLGYRNAYGNLPDSPHVPVRSGTRRMPRITDAGRAMDLGENGSYVAVRKLAQDVAGFWSFAEREGRTLFSDDPSAAERFASLLVGRTPDGIPLAAHSVGARPPSHLNRFGYRDRAGGALGCPIGAHVRRANPRDGLGDDPAESLAHVRAHRLIRRGRLYGPTVVSGSAPSPDPRGLFFLALCANLRRQFEFVHETWFNNCKFGGLTHERDPLVGRGPRLTSADGRDTFSLEDGPVRQRAAIERFVRVRGGAYLFLPGMRALNYLAEP
jgi:Dyp-type peroxidase family